MQTPIDYMSRAQRKELCKEIKNREEFVLAIIKLLTWRRAGEWVGVEQFHGLAKSQETCRKGLKGLVEQGILEAHKNGGGAFANMVIYRELI